VKKTKYLDTKVVLEKWIECKELIELEREDTTSDSQGGFQHSTTMIESSSTKWVTKWP
jgi:hypothetical protein